MRELAKRMLILDAHRAKLIYLRDEFLENDRYKEALPAIRLLIQLEDKINRIQHRVGLFEDYTWADPRDAVPGSPGRLGVDDGEILEVKDYAQ